MRRTTIPLFSWQHACLGLSTIGRHIRVGTLPLMDKASTDIELQLLAVIYTEAYNTVSVHLPTGF